MKKTLYVSDLDGTLLNRQGELSSYTASVIQRFIAQGGLFTISTARSLQACDDLIWLLGLQLPAILTNGSTIYSSIDRSYLEIKSMPQELLSQLSQIMDAYKICGFLYTISDEQISIHYQQIHTSCEEAYLAQRVERYNGRIYSCPHLETAAVHAIPIYMVAYGPYDLLSPMQSDISRLKGVCCELYENVYDGNYFLDIFPSSASKANGVLWLQNYTGAEEIVAFGDNFNDLSMLLAADRAYVPQNAVKAAKHIATDVLDYAHNDCVARFIAQDSEIYTADKLI